MSVRVTEVYDTCENVIYNKGSHKPSKSTENGVWFAIQDLLVAAAKLADAGIADDKFQLRSDLIGAALSYGDRAQEHADFLTAADYDGPIVGDE